MQPLHAPLPDSDNVYGAASEFGAPRRHVLGVLVLGAEVAVGQR
jgi:hypothetical protein